MYLALCNRDQQQSRNSMYHVLYDNIKLNGIHISIEYIPFTLLSIDSHKSGLCSKSYGLINIVLCPENTLCTYA